MSFGFLATGVLVSFVLAVVVFLSSLTFLSDVPGIRLHTISLGDSPPGERRALIIAGITTVTGFALLLGITLTGLVCAIS